MEGVHGGKLPSQNTQLPPPQKERKKTEEIKKGKGEREGERVLFFWCYDASDQ